MQCESIPLSFLHKLCEVDTPTVCNAIEVAQGKPETVIATEATIL